MRDVLLDQVPAALTSNWYLPVATGSALVGMLLERIFHRLGVLITMLDALTIGLFGAIGTTKALVARPARRSRRSSWASISAVGGSILRDLLLNLPIALMNVGSLYAVAALVGTVEPRRAGRVRRADVTSPRSSASSLTFPVRVLAVLFEWTLPEQIALETARRTARARPDRLSLRGWG